MSVYFITCRAQRICKIGTARNAKARFATLQTASATELRLEAVISGSRELEREFHERFKGSRLKGEWFTITDELDELIASSAEAVPHPDPDPVYPPEKRGPTIEELVEESLRQEHETYAECMAWRARHDRLESAA